MGLSLKVLGNINFYFFWIFEFLKVKIRFRFWFFAFFFKRKSKREEEKKRNTIDRFFLDLKNHKTLHFEYINHSKHSNLNILLMLMNYKNLLILFVRSNPFLLFCIQWEKEKKKKDKSKRKKTELTINSIIRRSALTRIISIKSCWTFSSI